MPVTCHWLQAMPIDFQMDELLTEKQKRIDKVLPDHGKKSLEAAWARQPAQQATGEALAGADADVWQSDKSVAAELFSRLMSTAG